MSVQPLPVWVAVSGEELCLDFVNTRYWRGTAAPTETLGDIDDLVAWCGARLGLPEATARLFTARASSQAIFAGAIELREGIYRLFHGIAEKAPPAKDDFTFLNRALAKAPTRQRLEALPAGFGWEVNVPTWDAAGLLTPVLWSAGDLLASRRLARLRRCANDQCHWLFLDDSKSGNRRWCMMSSCGNRAKAHRHYMKRKGAA